MNDFSFVRENNTDAEDMSTQLSMSMPIQSKKLQAEKKTNQIINKALRYMDKSKDFIQFTKKIMIPKVKRNLFLEEEQRKKNERMTHKLLSNGLKGFAKARNKKYNDQHNIYDDPNQYKQAKRYESLKGRRRKNRTPLNQQKAKSLTKIQLLTNKQRQQTIPDEKYDNENYIFLNLKKLGQSRELSEQVSQEQPLSKDKKDVRYDFTKRNKNQLSISLNIDNPNRPKVKSVDKHDRERLKMIQSGVKFGSNFATGKTHSYRKQSQIDIQTDKEKETSMGALFKLFPIKQTQKNDKKYKNDSIVAGLRSLLGMNTGLNTGLNRSPSRNSQKGINKINQNPFLQQLQQIKRYYQKSKQSSDCLYNLLSSISKQKNKDTIRIYRQDFSKIYTFRYGRDRITQFFDFEYIEDYSSLLELFTSTVLNFNQNQVMLISFMLLDFDNDGLISHSDLFNLLTLMDNNQLAKKTIYKIIKYVQQHVQRQKMGIKDSCQDDYMRKQNFTLKKYRFITYMKGKKQSQSKCSKQNSSIYKINNGRQQQSSVMNLQNRFSSTDRTTYYKHKLTNNSSSICRQHFLFKKSQKTGEQQSNDFKILRAFLQSMSKSSQILANGVSFFWINLQRFKSIYKQTIPQIYYDILYSAFGLQMKDIKNYDKIDVDTPLRKERKYSSIELQNDDEIDVLYENLSQMRYTKEDLRVKQLKPDIKRRRKIKNMLE